jgi:hypothetical protein
VKKLLCGILTIALALGLAACNIHIGEPQEQQHFNFTMPELPVLEDGVYTSERFGFRFTHPSGWEIAEEFLAFPWLTISASGYYAPRHVLDDFWVEAAFADDNRNGTVILFYGKLAQEMTEFEFMQLVEQRLERANRDSTILPYTFNMGRYAWYFHFAPLISFTRDNSYTHAFVRIYDGYLKLMTISTGPSTETLEEILDMFSPIE